jgi:hypothetical protein
LHWGLLIRQNYERVEAQHHEGSSQRYAKKSLLASGLLQALAAHPEWMSSEAVLIMGYTQLTAQYLSATGFRSPYAAHKDYHFQQQQGGFAYCLLIKDGHRPVFLVNVDYCYWGELSGELANMLLNSGKLYGLVHVAKTGQMAGDHSFNQIYLPRQFSLMKPSGEIVPIDMPLDLFTEHPGLSYARTGAHVSVSSTIEESCAVMSSAKAKGYVTVEVEGAHLCKTATKNSVRFGALYFASDYVASEPKATGHSTGVSLISGANATTNHKEDTLLEGIHHRLIQALGYKVK